MKNNNLNDEIFILVQGVRVYWDEDRDARIIDVVKAIIPELEYLYGYNILVVAHEHKGTMNCLIDMAANYHPKTDRAGNYIHDSLKELIEEIVMKTTGDFWTTSVYTHRDMFMMFRPESLGAVINSHISEVMSKHHSLAEWYRIKCAMSPLYKELEQRNKERSALLEQIVQLQNELGKRD